MKALIIAAGDHNAVEEADERSPAFLQPLIDRPFLQHIVEYITDAGLADSIEIVVSHLPERVEALLEDGTRWGVPIRYHLARDKARPYAAVNRFAGEGPVLLVHGDCLPDAAIHEPAAPPVLKAFCREGIWTGWAILDSTALSAVDAGWDREQLSEFILAAARARGTLHECAKVLGVRTGSEFIASQRMALDKQFPGLMFYGREVSEGIWIARNVALHPTATLVAPVYLGENCRIGSGIRLGPNVVVVRDCVLDSGSTATDSTVLPGSYVGQALELDHVIVDRNRLVNVRAGGETIVRDDFILSAISSTNFRSAFGSVLSRASALALLAFTWPIILVTMLALRVFRKGPVLHRREAVCLPADESSWAWKTFQLISFAAPASSHSTWGHLFLRFLPGLINVARGHLHLVGVEPRSTRDVMSLPVDWRVLYLRARAGAGDRSVCASRRGRLPG